MSELNERIREAAEECDTIEKMAELAGIPRRTLYGYLKGPREPKAAQLAAIASATGVTLEWLITGQQPKFRSRNMEQGSSASIDSPTLELRQLVMRRVKEIYSSSGLVNQPEQQAIVAMDIFQRLMERLTDLQDLKAVNLNLDALLYSLEQDLRRATENPGQTKRSAS